MADSLLLRYLSDSEHYAQGDNPAYSSPESHLHDENGSPSKGPREYNSFESRPTSPHNVSSPTSRWADQNKLLSVPGQRSRGNSFDSVTEAGQPSSISEETYINTSSSQGDKSTTVDRDRKLDHEVIPDEEALLPDPGGEAEFEVADNKFAFSPGQMGKLLNPKNLGGFHAVGGLAGLERGLRTSRSSGLSWDEQYLDGVVTFEDATNLSASTPVLKGDGQKMRRTDTNNTARSMSRKPSDTSFTDRKRVFSNNRLPERKSKNILQLAWLAYNDKVLLLLTGAAIISLALGLYQTFGTPSVNGEPKIEWVEGVAIVIAIAIVVIVGALNDYQKERQFIKLNKKKDDRIVRVIRSGKTQELSVHDILVGDVVLIEPGDKIPVDGIFIEGHSVKCDESSATGESDLLKKTPADEVYHAMDTHQNLKKMDPFIISGATVTEGIGSFLVTATGIHSSYGKTMMAMREDPEPTPLQSKLNVLAEYIAKLGGAAALLLFVVSFIEFLVKLRHNTSTPQQKGQQFLDILIVAITIVVVAVPEGLPLAVTLALAFATTRMLKDNNLVRLLRSCETMGNATSICSDKTGTLTENKMTVVAGTLGTASRFSDRRATALSSQSKGKQTADDEIDDVPVQECIGAINTEVKSLLEQSIVINSTAFEGEHEGVETFIGSKTETALLGFAQKYLGMGSISVERSNANIVQLFPFSSGRKCMAAVVKIRDGKYRMYVKGAPEILLDNCTKIITDPTKGVSDTLITKDNVITIKQIISAYATRSLRTLAFLYRDFEQWPPRNARRTEEDPKQAQFEDVFRDMTFLGVTGIQDPLREGVREAVQDCIHAGVFVRMVTGDNIMTARAIAESCGIYTPNGLIMEGPQFRKLSKKEMNDVIPRLQVLARSSPEDKRILVKRLKDLGETVAVTGDGTNDAPALKAADVGFSMGIAGTEVAKEASAIILMDDNFSSIVKALMWGRAVNDAVKKFLQFQITVNITAVLLTFVSAVSSKNQTSVLTAVQLLWVNLIMDTLAALALATDPPTRSIIFRKPDPKSAPLITLTMWKMIIGQAIYQLVVTFILFFAGKTILSYGSAHEQDQLQTLVFNTFVWMQIFNQLNCRRLDNKFNIFEGMFRNYFFLAIAVIITAGQTMIIFVGGHAFSTIRLNGAQWAYSIILGALSIPVGIVIRLVPDELIRKLIPDSFRRKAAPSLVVQDEEQQLPFNQALIDIRDELAFVKKIRGGRLNALKFAVQHPRETILNHSRSGSRSRSSSHLSAPQTPNPENHQHPTTTTENGEHSSASHPSPLPPTPDSRSRRRGRSRSNSAFGPAAAMAGIVAGSIVGWSPVDRATAHPGGGSSPGGGGGYGGGDSSSLKFSRNDTRPLVREDLEAKQGVEVHPDTKPDDPLVGGLRPPGSGRGLGVEEGLPPSQVQELTPAYPFGPVAGEPRVRVRIRFRRRKLMVR
ncbi:calcium-translocating P-type ATPase [Viridothelium virens]|uniref:Calcium-transporting ATPase n=1 Tax=Viridothelium virens TaxID=1048519 RepID=A0A6A6H484_VIRVR|nr:calcium-translocating P-type ATPase [Viridothelium virens]